MDSYTGRLLADRYRLPRTPSEEFELIEARAFDTATGQTVAVRQVPLPEVVDAETLDPGPGPQRPHGFGDRATRTPEDPVVRRAVEAAAAAARLPDHPRLDQVYDVFVQGDGLWIVSELLPARPLAAVLAEERLKPYRAAEVAADVLAALRIVHAHGWTHRNLTARTVMICEDGRAVLTGLAVGAAEEVLCGYDPLPAGPRDEFAVARHGEPGGGATLPVQRAPDPPAPAVPAPPAPAAPVAGAEVNGAAGGASDLVARLRQQGSQPPGPDGPAPPPALPPRGLPPSWDFEGGQGGHGGQESRAALPPARTPPDAPSPSAAERAARSGAIAAYRAGTQAGASAAGRPPSRNGAPAEASGPADLPGPRRASHPVRTGWEPDPAPAGPPPPQPQQPQPPQPPQPSVSPQPPQPPAGSPPRQGVTAAGRYRGPGTALAAERARQARMMTVGPVTERWAPEQAGPVYEHWRLAPPVGPAADFWALGALLFRAVQGYPPYPEEGAAALSQAVCAEQPAFAEDCGALRPIVESLLRQDPTERPSAEELRGWLRSLLRSAPEPEVGRRTVTAPPAALEPGRPADPRRLPIVRRRGPLVGPLRRRARAHRTPPRPFRLGSLLLGLVTLGMAGAIVFALLVMSDGGSAGRGSGSQDPGTTQAADGTAPEDTGGSQAGGQGQSGGSDDTATGDTQPTEDSQGTGEDTGADSGADTGEDAAVPDGYESRQDPAGFALTVPEGWERREAEEGRVIYTDGTVEIVVVSGRDTASRYGDDPMHYQLQDQSELDAFRDDQYATSSDLYETKVGDSVAAEGVFGWQEDGAQRVAHNMAVLIDDRYHVVMVRGPESESDEMSDIYDVVAQSYEITG